MSATVLNADATTFVEGLSGTRAKPMSARERTRGGWPGLDDASDDASDADERSARGAVTLIDVGAVVGGRYRIDRHLARGGMGAVWEATDLEAKDPRLVRVALKTMTACTSAAPEGHERFRREIALAQALDGPHFPRVSGAGVEDGMPFLALELLEGETLLARLEREERLPIETCRWLVRELCLALGAAHALGIVHRDVTPTNIFLVDGPDGPELKLLDLGIAKHHLFDTKLTATGVLVGSPHYMSPEQVANVDVGYRTDLWSAAVVVYRALTGRRPFEGANGMAVLAAALRQPEIPASSVVPELGPDVDAFFEIALAKTASARFGSAERMAAAFDAATAHLVGLSPVRAEGAAEAATGGTDGTATPGAVATDRDTSTVIAHDDYGSFAAVASQESAAALASDDATAVAFIEDSTDDERRAPTVTAVERHAPTRRVVKRAIPAVPAPGTGFQRLVNAIRAAAADLPPAVICAMTAIVAFAAFVLLARSMR